MSHAVQIHQLWQQVERRIDADLLLPEDGQRLPAVPDDRERKERNVMNKVRAMGARRRGLPLLIGALALTIGGRASADCLLSNSGWQIDPGSSVDAAGTVTLNNGLAAQGLVTQQQVPFAAQYPVLSGTVQNVNCPTWGLVEVSVVLYDSGGNGVGQVIVSSPQAAPDSCCPPAAYEGRPWTAGTTTDFSIDVRAMLTQHFPGVDLSTVSSAGVYLITVGGTAIFSNLCLTDNPPANPQADLSVTYNSPPGTVVTGSQLTYTVAVQNAGPQPAAGVVVTLPLPAGTAFVSAPGSSTGSKGKISTVTWNLGTLASSGSATLTLTVKVSAKAGATINGTASVSSSSPQDPNPANNSATAMTQVTSKR
jgi:uncharacterized repeat protein (TIGR01451 family)